VLCRPIEPINDGFSAHSILTGTVLHSPINLTGGGCVGDLSASTAHQTVYQTHHNEYD